MPFLRRISFAEFLLRCSLSFALLFPPIDAIWHAYAWLTYFPTFLTDFVAPHTLLLLHAFGVFEVSLAIWILVGKSVRLPSLIAAFLLLMIVFFNLSSIEIVFRDISLMGMALALAFVPRGKRTPTPAA